MILTTIPVSFDNILTAETGDVVSDEEGDIITI